MKFRTLQDKLRRSLLVQIEQGELTGLRLAEEAGFKQAHISNFLNSKRGLSLDAMDRILKVQGLSVMDLLDPAEINRRATIPATPETEFESVFLVDPEIAAVAAVIASGLVKEVHKFRRSFLRKLRTDLAPAYQDYERFILLRVDAPTGMSMYPRLLPGATVLIDRHYNSPKPYRRGESNMYAVRKADSCTIRYLEVAGNNLVLRPNNQAYPVEVLQIKKGSVVADYIVGRVCYVGIET
jgi:Peptidase S24-like